jgi:hypothetical protein
MLEFATNAFKNLLGVVFLSIFARILLFPQDCLSGVGVDYNSQSITGRAELRAYYAGTSLCLSAILFDGRVTIDTKLKSIAYTLGGFVLGRVVNYYRLGKDPDDHSGEIVVALEIIGLVACVALRYLNCAGRRKQS